MSFVADIFGAKSAAKGQQKAADAAKQAAEASLAEQRRQYDQSRSDMMPWIDAGKNALNTITQLNAGDYGSWQNSPDYKVQQQEGARALTARNALLGLQDSGAAQKSALKYSQDLAQKDYNDYYNKLAGVAGTGQVQTNNAAQLGQNYAGAVTGINQNKANALGSSYINQGNIWGNLFSNLGGQATAMATKFLGF